MCNKCHCSRLLERGVPLANRGVLVSFVKQGVALAPSQKNPPSPFFMDESSSSNRLQLIHQIPSSIISQLDRPLFLDFIPAFTSSRTLHPSHPLFRFLHPFHPIPFLVPTFVFQPTTPSSLHALQPRVLSSCSCDAS